MSRDPSSRTATHDRTTVRIVVTAYASQDHLRACLDALAGQSFEAFEVVVVDNGGSPTASGYHEIEPPDPRFSLTESPVNDGFAGGFRRGVADAQTDLLMSVNPDTQLDPDCLAQLVDAWHGHDRPAMLSPILYRSGERDRFDGLGDSLSVWGIAWRNGYDHTVGSVDIPEIAEVFAPTGAAAVYDRRAYQAAGGINPDLFCYLEDVDLGLRLRAHGGRCLLVGTATGVHVGGHSTDPLAGFSVEHTARNGLAMLLGSAPVLLLPILLPLYVMGQLRLHGRNRHGPNASHRRRGFRRAFGPAAKALFHRFQRAPYPLGASLRVARWLDWGIRGLRGHEPRLRRWESTPRPPRN